MGADIGSETLNVGNALASVRIDEMLTNLAKGIAWGQFDLDKVGIDVCKMMGIPGTVSIGKDKLSMIETGFLPTFYQFVDTILELKLEIKMREEQVNRYKSRDTVFTSSASVKESESTRKKQTDRSTAKSKSMYSRTIDASYSQKYSHEINASSFIRTKLVPKPGPDVLLERLKVLVENMRIEAEKIAKKQDPKKYTDNLESALMDQIESKLLGRIGKTE